MKLLPVFLSALAIVGSTHSGVARAQASDSGSWGRNRLNQTILITGDIITFKNDAKGRRTDEAISTVAFDGECVWVGVTPSTQANALDCRQGTSSPLAGTYYKFRFSKTHRNQCGRGSLIYECQTGCGSSRAPSVFVAEPYEC